MTEAHRQAGEQASLAPEEPKGAENMIPNSNSLNSTREQEQCPGGMDGPAPGPEAGQKRAIKEEEGVTDEREQKRVKVEHSEVKAEVKSEGEVKQEQSEVKKEAAPAGGEGGAAPAPAPAEDPPKPIELPKPEFELAAKQLEQVCGKKIGLGTRLEVCWEVVDDENEDEEEIPPIWWECEIKELVAGHAMHTGIWLLSYDEKEVEGKAFPAEERKVAFCAKNMLIDIESEMGGIGGGDKGLMQWRFENSGDELLPLLSRGTSCKARCRGGDTWHAGQVFDVNCDGTYQISYEDGDFEDAVVREYIEPVEGVDTSAEMEEDEEVVAEDIDSFFELFTATLTAGPMFQGLDPDKQRIASEKINSMRPLFREELEKIRDARGLGTTITGEDIVALIPSVMKRRAELDAAEKEAAAATSG